MDHIIAFDGKLDVDLVQLCLRYLCDTFGWLAAEGQSHFYSVAIEARLSKEHLSCMTKDTDRLYRNICHVQNYVPKINTLPPEILAAIFEHLKALSPVPLHLSSMPLLPYPGPAGRTRSLRLSQSMFSWLTVGRVCRHWRETSLHFPQLWDMIFIRDPPSEERVVGSELRGATTASVTLSRSGTVPLDFHVQAHDPGSDFGSSRQVLLDILSQSPRIRGLRLNPVRSQFLDHLATLDATRLENLVVAVALHHRGWPVVPTFSSLFNNWNTPNLRSLAAYTYTGWQHINVRTLRHLILAGQHFNLALFQNFLRLLGISSQLQDLVVYDSDIPQVGAVWQEVREFAQSHPTISLPCLKRLRLINTGSSAPHDITLTHLLASKLAVPSDCAQVYDLCGTKDLPLSELLPLLQPLRPHRLQLGQSVTVATGADPSSSPFLVHFGGYRRIMTDCMPPDDVKELWLYLQFVYPREGTPDDWLPVFGRMRQLTKLVVRHSVHKILPLLASSPDLFPALSELHLHAYRDQEDLILRYLSQRKKEGRALRKLRIFLVRKARSPARQLEAFSSWKAALHELAAVADVVVFDELEDEEWMELPLVCKTGAEAHTFWPTWQELCSI